MTAARGTSPTPSATIRWGAWYADRGLELDFPAGWTVVPCPPEDGPDIGADGIARALAEPIGTPRLSELARGRRRPCIAVDDLSRPTPADRLIPPILDELTAAGIRADEVLVLVATANHRPLTNDDLRRKIGDAVLERCRLSQHFSWDGCREIGTTGMGTPVEVNAELLDADLRILVGSIIPHAATGFSGGAKMLMPGLASSRAALAFHRGPALQGRYAEITDARLDAEEAARMVGIDFLVNAVPSSTRGVAALVAGDVVDAYRRGATLAASVFATPAPGECDVGVFSLYPKDTEFLQHLTALAPWKTGPYRPVREGGTIVIAAAATEGLGFHSLFGPGMQLAAPGPTTVRGRDVVFFSPGMTAGALPAAARSGTTLLRTWEETVAWLEAKHGPSASVAVFPCATMQLLAG